MRIITTFLFILLFHSYIKGQVKTNYNSTKRITSTGQYNKSYRASLYDINPPDTNKIIERDAANKKINDVKPFRFAEPIPVNINVVESAQWIEDSTMAYGKFSIRVKTAKSLSVNFGDFFLPNETEMFIYNKSGNMITGPIKERENNKNRIWGSSVYKGDELTIELKLPKALKKYLKLNIENVAFGYVEIYGFGNSSNCNINVICALGNGWEQERNSVALILNQDGSSWCTGSLVNNTCNVAIPYFLTANHCFTGQDVTRWRFIFQYWSPTCTPNQDDLNNLLFNGSTLRANNAGSDFALVELSQTPDAASNITYAGWSRETTGKLQTTIIHHPAGDVMKISRDNGAPTFSNFLGAQCWQLGLDLGATNGGSSGAPYFDQNHRIIAQHYGINQNNSDQCLNTNKFGGRFDISWTGGGTNATRLSNWLDPNNTGAVTTNTTNVSNLIPPPTGGSFLPISGNSVVCGNSETYSITGGAPNATVVWSLYGPFASGGFLLPLQNVCSLSPSGSQATLTKINNGTVTLGATITNCNGIIQYARITVTFGVPEIYSYGAYMPNTQGTYYTTLDQSGTATFTPGTINYVTLESSGNNSYNWVYDGGTSNAYYYLSFPAVFATLGWNTPVYPYDYMGFTIHTSNACGTRSDPVWFYYDGAYQHYRVAPNPVKSTFTITQLDFKRNPAPPGKKQANPDLVKIQIVDKMGTILMEQKYPSKTKSVTVNTATLKTDIYTVRLFTEDNKVESHRLVVQH